MSRSRWTTSAPATRRLSYLSRFPVDILKMDRSFLREGATPGANGLANAVVGLGATLSLEVVAEGIEEPEQWRDAARARLRPRPGLPVRAPDEGRRVAGVRGRAAARRPPMLHSYEGLDRAGRHIAPGAAGPAAPSRLPPAVERDVRLAPRRRRLHRRAGLAGLPAERRPDRDGHRRHRDDRADDRLPPHRRRRERSARSTAPDARGGPARGCSPPATLARTQRSPGASSSGTVAILVAVYGTGQAFFAPAFDAIVPELVPGRAACTGQRARPDGPADRPPYGRSGARRRPRRRVRRRRRVRARRASASACRPSRCC